jgi:hypothetical protein
MTEETNNPGGTDPTKSGESAIKGDPEPTPGVTTSDPEAPTEEALKAGDPEPTPGG